MDGGSEVKCVGKNPVRSSSIGKKVFQVICEPLSDPSFSNFGSFDLEVEKFEGGFLELLLGRLKWVVVG